MADALIAKKAGGFKVSQLSGPILILLILVMLVIPLPPAIISLCFAFNIAAGLMILGMSLYISQPAEFSAFPSILLATTLMRLALNVATARAILLNGYTGPGAAGRVIEAFGNFAVGGNYVVGAIIFVILIVINFVVVTKGASRVAEVSARFMLDSLPGRQMAIDAEVSANPSKAKDAEKRREALRQEADFFGAMDGASKFVRGDVIAAMIILAINMIGGLVIGVMQSGLTVEDAARTYTLLTIGDGLAAQIPALTISIAAGLVVTRVSTGDDITVQVSTQFKQYPKALLLAAVVTGAIGLMPGIAHITFFAIAGALGFGYFSLSKKQEEAGKAPVDNSEKASESTQKSDTHKADQVKHLSGVDALGLDLGFSITYLVEKGMDQLTPKLKNARLQYGKEMGFVVPPVVVRDSKDTHRDSYNFKIRGASIGGAEVYRDYWLAIEGKLVTEKLSTGNHVKDPSFGQPAVWIDKKHIAAAEKSGYTVVDPQTVIATHLLELLKKHGSELLGRNQIEALIERLKEVSPKLAEDLRAMVPMGLLRSILQALLAEGVPIVDFEQIAEVMVEAADVGKKDPEELLLLVRRRLGRFIIARVSDASNILKVAVLKQSLDEDIRKALQVSMKAGKPEISPDTANRLRAGVAIAVKTMKEAGFKPVLMVNDSIRRHVALAVQGMIPVISHEEVPSRTNIKVVQSVEPQTA